MLRAGWWLRLLRSRLVILTLLAAAAATTTIALVSRRPPCPAPPDGLALPELVGSYVTVVDERGNELFATAMNVSPGDEFISADDRRYRVDHVRGGRAHAREVTPSETASPPTYVPAGVLLAIPRGAQPRTVVVYHTHGDESYRPTSGTTSEPEGGDVIDVGDVFAKTLEDRGFDVVHDRHLHVPHDAAAYQRSRRTLLYHLKTKLPFAAFDIHRDAVPRRYYLTRAEGKPVAQVMIVVGRQNPFMGANYRLARTLKSVSADLFPNLVRGIFFAKGSYNQDLDPATLLLEIGTASQKREEAERGAELFAKVVANTLLRKPIT